MRILLAQINPFIGDLPGNTAQIIAALHEARKMQAQIVLFPELVLCGYPPQDLLFFADFIDEAEKCLPEIMAATQDLFVVVGTIRRGTGEKKLYNTAAVLHDGKLLGFQDKFLLPTYDVFDERRYFDPAEKQQLFDFKGQKIGILICEDIWQHAGVLSHTDYKKDPVSEMARLSPDLVLNLSASPYYYQMMPTRDLVLRAAIKTLQCPLAFCNLVGGADELVFDGHSSFFDAEGKQIAQACGFAKDLLFVDSTHSGIEPAAPMPIADLFDALLLGLRDYFAKQGFTKACLGLSGGIDSAVTLSIAAAALQPKNLLAVTMPSRYTDPRGLADAALLCKNLGVELQTISIDQSYQHFLDLLEPSFLKKPFGVAEQNIQARVRGLILMAFSNKLGYIVLSAANKSEVAIGYSTLYGDMCGGLGVLSDVCKTRVYELAAYINRQKKIIPKGIIERAPSAELKENQKDQDDLPPYAVIDAVLEDYVEEHLTAKEIIKKRGFSLELVEDLICKIHLAEYKRRQGPPCIRVTKKAFSKGRTFPIVRKIK